MWWALIVVAGLGKSSLPVCTDVPGHLDVPDNITKIPDLEYKDCDFITNVTFNTDGALETIGGQSFYRSDLSGHLFIPNSVKIIKELSFSGTKITSLEFEDNIQLEIIENNVFASCYNLTGNIEIPFNVTTIKSRAFLSTAITGLQFASQDTLQNFGFGSFCRLPKLNWSHCYSKHGIAFWSRGLL